MKKKRIHIGVIRETKAAVDRRVPLTPSWSRKLRQLHPEFEISVESSDIRCFRDDEYRSDGIDIVEDISGCDILLGVKEVDLSCIIPGKTYMFFSHTTKKQTYNRKLLQEMVKKNTTLIDYEHLTDKCNRRLVSFSRWAGIIGAYNGLRGYGIRLGNFHLKPPQECRSGKEEMSEELAKVSLPPVKILVTGGGRAAGGAMEMLACLELKRVNASDFLEKEYRQPVLCRIEPCDYVKRKNGKGFSLQHFIDCPDEYISAFSPYGKVTDMLLACHYWDPRSPLFLAEEDYRKPGFNISVIADVSCDIAGPIASTLRASTIDKPFYGYNPGTAKEGMPFDAKNVTVMAVDNLPGALPRDASSDFAEILVEKVLPSILGDSDGIIQRGTVVKNGKLTSRFAYLKEFLAGRE